MEHKELKRQRSENWNNEDKLLLKELIRKNVKKIENKNTDTNTNLEKKKAWVEVEESFNELCTGNKRTMTQLKTQWAATKITARKEVADHRKEVKKTGGGPQPADIPVSSDDISVWLPNEFLIDTNQFDSDFVLEEVSVETIIEEDEIKEDEKKEDEVEIIEVPKVSPIFKKKSQEKKTTEDSIKSLADFDIKCRDELHKLQMKTENQKLQNVEKEGEVIAGNAELQMLQIEAEKKRLRNLDMEFAMMKAKKAFYEND